METGGVRQPPESRRFVGAVWTESESDAEATASAVRRHLSVGTDVVSIDQGRTWQVGVEYGPGSGGMEEGRRRAAFAWGYYEGYRAGRSG
jgi:hypothetical protein